MKMMCAWLLFTKAQNSYIDDFVVTSYFYCIKISKSRLTEYLPLNILKDHTMFFVFVQFLH